MRKTLLSVIFITLCAGCFAQITIGLTGKPDTSFNINSDYKKNIKKYPFIRMVPDSMPASVAQKQNITYCNNGKRDLQLDVFYPKNIKKAAPAVLIIFGGGWRSGNRAMHYPLAEHLAALGYVCFTADYTLSTEALYPEAVYNLKAALRWIRANAKPYHIDANQVSALGFSAGGELAAFLGATNGDPKFEGNEGNAKYSSRVNAVVDIDGTLSFVHPESGEGDDSKNISAATYWFGYSKKDNIALWTDASPLSHAGKTAPPYVFINSAIDRMHAGRNDFIRILDENHTYSEMHAIPGTPHTFCLYYPWFDETVKYIDSFFKRVYQL
ncbi:esterase [Mucilaginibacter sp. PPCGB 2223]|uniref:alpha/beta hydrolase n=1 Tax=Mucilaginibacter sp. PPCGB 2223 TaxID=1886027 RepID=UPI000825436B|nr:alpha/beta hydrolase [Mucilaginibacter sp. PPCGB 2223]OCX53768.1 esterase [Mucilaginibacter sp. PPCGB 2223]